jgi:hypothetical protein
MICQYCGNRRYPFRITKINRNVNQYITFISCGNCENVVFEPPDHIPEEQKERYLERIQKGKDDK